MQKTQYYDLMLAAAYENGNLKITGDEKMEVTTDKDFILLKTNIKEYEFTMTYEKKGNDYKISREISFDKYWCNVKIVETTEVADPTNPSNKNKADRDSYLVFMEFSGYGEDVSVAAYSYENGGLVKYPKLDRNMDKKTRPYFSEEYVLEFLSTKTENSKGKLQSNLNYLRSFGDYVFKEMYTVARLKLNDEFNKFMDTAEKKITR